MNFSENMSSKMVKKHKKEIINIINSFLFVSLQYTLNIILYIKFITIVIIYCIKKRNSRKKITLLL